MPNIITPIEWVEIDMICDKCGKGRMRGTGTIYPSSPAQYLHVCNACGYSMLYLYQYPHTEYRRKEATHGDDNSG